MTLGEINLIVNQIKYANVPDDGQYHSGNQIGSNLENHVDIEDVIIACKKWKSLKDQKSIDAEFEKLIKQ